MKKLFEVFVKPSLEDWKNLLAKELKSEKTCAFEDEIEDMYIEDIYTLKKSVSFSNTNNTNDWKIGVEILVNEEKTANKQALEQLNFGANALNFVLSTETIPNLDILLHGIEIRYIHSYFTVKNDAQETFISTWYADKSPLFLHINTPENFIQGSELKAIGANSTQELAYVLAKGISSLAKNHVTSFHFTFGIGSNFLVEIAKFRAFHLLWDKLKNTYQTTAETFVTAITGCMNKSLKDPYTNLLRQTTEGLSAVLGGVDQLIILPYDSLSETGSTSFSERMAINTSLILKEESEINQLLDPFAGSFVVEKYTESLCDAAWKLFQQLEALGGCDQPEAQQLLSDEIKRIRTKRIEKIVNKQQTLVGINNYPNPDSSELRWKSEIETFLGMEQLVLERDFDSAQSDKKDKVQ